MKNELGMDGHHSLTLYLRGCRIAVTKILSKNDIKKLVKKYRAHITEGETKQ